MNCIDALCRKFVTIGTVGNGESLEFDNEGRVHVVRKGGWREINRKLVNLSGQSRKTTIDSCRKVIEQANDLVAGMLGLAPLALECSALRTDVHASANNGENTKDDASDGASSAGSPPHLHTFRAHCTQVEREKLARIAVALEQGCVGLNTLMNSTYKDDNDTCAALLMLISSAQSVIERAQSAQVPRAS